jgi:hypothetical protein
MTKLHLTVNINIKMEGQECKTGCLQGWVPLRKGKKGEYTILYTYENTTMKPVEIVLSRGEEG